MLEPSLEDTERVERQLGRPTRARWRVVKRCHLGVPMVLENHPLLEDGSPFPTLYWLTCPILVKRVSSLEAAGEMTELSRRLGTDDELRARLAEAMGRYIAARNQLAVVADAGAPPGGGPDKVKCLHAHAAHELAGGNNPIGALALERTGWPDCRVPCVSSESDGP